MFRFSALFAAIWVSWSVTQTKVQGFLTATPSPHGWYGGSAMSLTTKTRISSVTDGTETKDTSVSTATTVAVDPKEAVKLFGRLAEKYIMLDATAGMCCYSACSDCEYRLPDGGYRMSDQSAARPKWIPNYTSRSVNNKEHTTKWSAELFAPSNNVEDEEGSETLNKTTTALTQEMFVERVRQMTYAPTLGGPYLSASEGAVMGDETAARALFDILADGKDVLTKNRMSIRLKQLAGGEEGLTWAMFQKALAC